MDLEGRGLVLQEGLPVFFFPLMDQCHSREGQGRWNLVASWICVSLQEFVLRQEEVQPVSRLGTSDDCWETGQSLIILSYLSRIS